MLHPITFSIPQEKIVNSIPTKKKILSDLIPGIESTYIYNTEESYYNEYKSSLFAITRKKAGWDCLSHYEILANGCIPLFENIDNCPPNIMALLPKDLLIKANKLFNEKFSNTNSITEDAIHQYYSLNNKLLDYTRTNLTTYALSKYLLNKIDNKNVSKVLFLSEDINPDYLRCLTLHGLKEVFGSNCHDYPKIPHLYKNSNLNYSSRYGRGITYTNLLHQECHNEELDYSIKEDIKNHFYDVVIYGSFHRGMPYYDLVSNSYNPKDIILICGEDEHNCIYNDWVSKGHTVFVKELIV